MTIRRPDAVIAAGAMALALAAALAVGPPATPRTDDARAAGPRAADAAPAQGRVAARDTDGWQRAAPGRPIVLPDDHAAHPDYRLEWWYYTGNVEGDDGHPYGYQVTFFRYGVAREPANASAWAVRDLYMTHVAVTDVAAGRHHHDDRLNRAGVHWAGARADRYEVWNETWRASRDGEGTHHLQVDTDAFSLDLRLDEGKPAALQGLGGYSRKGSDPGNASYYYSLTRMPTRGLLRLGGRTVTVRGHSWMDHEFGTSALEPGTQGWDWFALQLDDGRDLMVFRLRRLDGQRDPYSAGTWVAPDGTTRALGADDFTIAPRRHWTSPVSDATYPVAWDLSLPDGVSLRVTAVVDAQELVTRRSTNVTYWEGAVRVEGWAGQTPLTGRGYVELTGYAGGPMSDVMR